MKYAWTGWPRAIEANRDSYSVTMMCDLLSVSRSGLHDARGREPSLRTVDNTQIVKRIQRATPTPGPLWPPAHDPGGE